MLYLQKIIHVILKVRHVYLDSSGPFFVRMPSRYNTFVFIRRIYRKSRYNTFIRRIYRKSRYDTFLFIGRIYRKYVYNTFLFIRRIYWKYIYNTFLFIGGIYRKSRYNRFLFISGIYKKSRYNMFLFIGGIYRKSRYKTFLFIRRIYRKSRYNTFLFMPRIYGNFWKESVYIEILPMTTISSSSVWSEIRMDFFHNNHTISSDIHVFTCTSHFTKVQVLLWTNNIHYEIRNILLNEIRNGVFICPTENLDVRVGHVFWGVLFSVSEVTLRDIDQKPERKVLPISSSFSWSLLGN